MSCNTSIQNECAFLRDIIGSFEKMLPFICGDEFGDKITANMKFEGSVAQEDTYVLSPLGSMMFIYVQVTKRTFPTVYTPNDIDLINQIWVYLGRPENKILL